jgi:hypothetical protein
MWASCLQGSEEVEGTGTCAGPWALAVASSSSRLAMRHRRLGFRYRIAVGTRRVTGLGRSAALNHPETPSPHPVLSSADWMRHLLAVALSTCELVIQPSVPFSLPLNHPLAHPSSPSSSTSRSQPACSLHRRVHLSCAFLCFCTLVLAVCRR